jgi:hypothetical protein
VADALEPPDPAAWNDFDHAFFASAPPDIPEPPPEPMRFDDLDPIPPVRPATGGDRRGISVARRRVLAAASAAPTRARRLSAASGRRVVPALASVGRHAVQLTVSAWRRSARAFRVVRWRTGRTTKATIDHFTSLLAAQMVNRRGPAIVVGGRARSRSRPSTLHDT